MKLNKERIIKSLFKVALVIVFSLSIHLILDLSLRGFRIFDSIIFMISNFKNVFLSVIALSIVTMILLIILNNMVLSMGLFFYFSVVLSVSNFIKIQLRAEPILPSDVDSLAALTSLVKMIDIKFVLLFFVFTLLTFFLLFKLNNRFSSPFFQRDGIGRASKLVLGLMAFLSVISISNVHAQNNSFRKGMNLTGFRYYQGSTLLSFEENSFVLAFIDNLAGPAMEKPTEYSEALVYKTLEKYQENTNFRNAGKDRESFEDISVVFILSESLADPRVISGTNLDQSPIAYIQDVSDKYVVGKSIVPVYGGGTPNAEFEALTGFAIQNFRHNMSIPYQKVIPHKTSFPTFVESFKKDNLEASAKAIHSYNSKLYKRKDVFSIMGFDEMYFAKDMTHQEGLYDDYKISDASLYQELLDHLSTDPSNQFLHLLSMQNHVSYSDIFPHYEFAPITDGSDALDETFKYYLQGLHITDIETKNLIKSIDAMERKVAVVFYGDHHPGIYSSIIDDATNAKDPFSLYTTDFFVYTNFSDDKITLDEPVSLTNIKNYLYDAAGVKTNAIHQLVWDVRKEILAGAGDMYLLNNNQVLTFEELSQKQQGLLRDYHLIQYDIIDGNSYSQNYIEEKGW